MSNAPDCVGFRWQHIVAIVVALSLFAYTILLIESHLQKGFLADDAYISLRHAKTFVDGHGFNYNAGERVEGYTNFSLTALLAVPYWLGLDAIVFVKTICVIASASLIVTTGMLTRRLAGDFAGAVVMVLLALDERLSWLATCGLETMMVAAFYVPAILLLDRGWRKVSALLFVGAVLTRMESVLLVAMAAAYLSAKDFSPSGRKQVFTFSAWFGIPYAAYFFARFAYYGWLFPNTFYAKVGSATSAWKRGVDYIDVSFTRMHFRTAVIVTVGALVVAAVLALVRVFKGKASWRPGLGILVVASSAIYVLFVIVVGGDHFGERFIYHFYPLLLVAMAWAWSALFGALIRAPRFQRAVPAAVGAVVCVLGAPVPMVKASFGAAGGISGWASVGAYIREHSSPNATVATCAAGVLALESERRTIDMLGLSDVHIAHLKIPIGTGYPGHEKSDPAYVIDRRPEFISTWVDDDEHVGRGFRRFFQFWRDYQLVGLVRMDVLMPISSSNVVPFTEEPSPDTIGSYRTGKGLLPGKHEWGLWGRRTSPMRPRPFGRRDIGSRIAGGPDHPGLLVVAPKGHEPTHIVFGHDMIFPPGEYRVSYDIQMGAVDGVGPSTPLCKFDIWDGVVGTHATFLTAADYANRTGTLSVTFGITPETASRRVSFPLYCEGLTDVTVLRGSVEQLSP